MKKALVLLAALFLPACLMATAGKSSANITILSVTNLAGVQATDNITVGSTSTLKNTYITANGKALRNGYEWKTGATTAATATNLAAALNRITGIEASAASNVVYATATSVGTGGNAYTLTAYGSALTVSSAQFTGGVNAAYLTIDGIKMVFGVDVTVGVSPSATATNLVTAIQANTFLDSLMDVTATGAVVYATSTQVGDNAYPLVGYPTNKILVSSAVFSSGGNPSGVVSFYKTVVADRFYGDGSNLTGISGASGVLTGVTAGTGLSGGGTSGNVTLNVTNAPSASTATNIAGGSDGTIPYQSAANTTQMLAAGTTGYALMAHGSYAPTWELPQAFHIVAATDTTSASINVASTSYVGVDTITVTLNGNRPVRFDSFINIDNEAGGARTYTVAIVQDGVVVPGDAHLLKLAASGATGSLTSWHYTPAGLSPGAHTFSVWVLSSSATGTQTVIDVHLYVKEE